MARVLVDQIWRQVADATLFWVSICKPRSSLVDHLSHHCHHCHGSGGRGGGAGHDVKVEFDSWRPLFGGGWGQAWLLNMEKTNVGNITTVIHWNIGLNRSILFSLKPSLRCHLCRESPDWALVSVNSMYKKYISIKAFQMEVIQIVRQIYILLGRGLGKDLVVPTVSISLTFWIYYLLVGILLWLKHGTMKQNHDYYY